MSAARLRRLARLEEIRADSLSRARESLARSRAASEAAAASAREAERELDDAMTAASSAAFTTVDAFASSRSHLDGLRLRLESRSKIAAAARAEEDREIERCVAADREVKKVEMLRETIERADREKEARRERKVEDETAARTAARGDR